ncbi:MAG: prephenate dehydrogenase/arogenate dehydrogenase family protein [Firmicutes bacterium]|nr:prephenate dehydrogenase/arogenate dehydrogenase family protein [Bacillota bacterium]
MGLGLIGGSIGLGLRRAGGYRVIGFDTDPQTLELAVSLGAIDRAAQALNEVTDCDAIVVAVPLLAMEGAFRALARALEECAVRRPQLIMDVGSAKRSVMGWARACFEGNVPFVGGHPMAGTEHHGIKAATSEMFRTAAFVLTPSEWADQHSIALARSIATDLGARPVMMDPESHDRMVAATSHLPLLCAAAISSIAAARADSDPDMWVLAGGGFRDSTRVASGAPELGTGIMLANADEIRRALEELIGILSGVLGWLEASDSDDATQALTSFFDEGRRSRAEWLATLGPRRGHEHANV